METAKASEVVSFFVPWGKELEIKPGDGLAYKVNLGGELGTVFHVEKYSKAYHLLNDMVPYSCDAVIR